LRGEASEERLIPQAVDASEQGNHLREVKFAKRERINVQ
jgi:hypothetical protein